MGFLAGKRLLVTGVLSNRSIAYGIARALRREGAELAFSYQGDASERVRISPPSSARLCVRATRRRRRPIEAMFASSARLPTSTASSTRSASTPRSNRPRLPQVSRARVSDARHLELQLSGDGQGRRAGLATGWPFHPTYWGAAQVPNSTRWPGQGIARASVRYRRSLGPKGCGVNGSRPGRSDAGRLGSRGSADPRFRRAERAPATQRDDRRRRQRRPLPLRTWRPASRRKSLVVAAHTRGPSADGPPTA